MKKRLAENNHTIKSFDPILDKLFGEVGTELRNESEEKAYAFYSGKLIEDARKHANMTQLELAQKIGTSKTYISRVENGYVEPKVSTFYRIMSDLGCSIQVVFS
jgi:DNA-binding XRE family transcriptional regulator